MKKLIKNFNKYFYFIPVFLLGLVPIIWFLGKDSGVIINGLDTNFPLNPLLWFQRRFFVWNNISNAGADFSSSTAGLFFHFVQVVPYLFGFSLQNVEIISLIFWFFLIVSSSYLLSRLLFPKNYWAQLTLVILYTFNIYLFNTWENIKVSNLSLYAVLPFLFWLLFCLSRHLISYKKGFLYLVGLAIVASGSGINPAYFSVILLAIVLFGLIFSIEYVVIKKSKDVLIACFLAIVVILGVNLFWILPLVRFLTSHSISGISDIGYTNWLNGLSKNTSLMNVIRLQGAWDWYVLNQFKMPEYIPYALNYFRKLPFILFSFVPPFLAFLSLALFKKERRGWYFFAAVLMILGIFLGAGSHEPTGSFFLFLSKHLPMFSFFRSPWYIFTPLLTIAYALLIGLLVERIIATFKSRWLILAKLGLLCFWLGYFLYSYPLITGKIFRSQRSDSFFVTFPDYVWQTRDYLNQNENKKSSGRIITYPDDQLEAFSWGYRGTESILGLFFNAEFITPSFSSESINFTRILETFYRKIKDRDNEGAKSLLPLLGVDKIFIKKDTSTNSPIPEDLISGTNDKVAFGPWVLLNLNNLTTKIFSPQYLYADHSNYGAMIGAASALPFKSAVIVGKGDKEVEKAKLEGRQLYLDQAYPADGSQLLANENKNFVFNVSWPGNYKIYVEKRGVDPKLIKVRLDTKPLLQYQEFNEYIIFSLTGLGKGEHNLKIDFPLSQNLLIRGDSTDLLQSNGLRSEELPIDKQNVIVLYNPRNVDKNLLLFYVKDFSTKYSYTLEFDYKYFYGSTSTVEFIQFSPRSPVVNLIEKIGNSQDWQHKKIQFSPLKIDSKLEVYFHLPRASNGGGSKTFLENVTLKRDYDNEVFILQEEQKSLNAPEIIFQQISPVKYSLTVTKSNSEGYVIAFLEKYSKDWRLTSSDPDLRNISLPHFMLNGYANGWYIPRGKDNQSFIIYYLPQRLFILGLSVSLLIIVASLVINKWKK